MTGLRLLPKQIRLAAIGAAVIVSIGVIGTTAALATDAGHPAPPQADLANVDGRLLTINATPPPKLTMPVAPAADDKLVVLADAPADLAYDGDLRSSLEAAALLALDAAEARRSAAQTASWKREEAILQAQMDAAGRYPDGEISTPVSAPAAREGGDVTTVAGARPASVL